MIIPLHEYGLVSRPKSDIVCRTIAKAFRWPIPRGKFIGWDFKPLPKGFVVPGQMGLMELAKKVKDQFQNTKMKSTE